MTVSRFCERLGIPRSTYYYWRECELSGRSARRWPAPVVDAVSARAQDYAEHYSAWGHRKIHAMIRADGIDVSASSVARALKRLGLLLPARHMRERRQLAASRREAFLVRPNRRNLVWQMDFTEFETAASGTWRICPVVDYATKLALAAPVTGTMKGLDACAALREAINRAEDLLGYPLVQECVDRATGELHPLRIVTDNGAAFRSLEFMGFFNARPWLEHIRTRNHAPETNGVVERFNRSLKYEQLYRLEIVHAEELADAVDEFVALYNEIRPHEGIGFRRPLDVYTAD
jgi:transposase InsO family protein